MLELNSRLHNGHNKKSISIDIDDGQPVQRNVYAQHGQKITCNKRFSIIFWEFFFMCYKKTNLVVDRCTGTGIIKNVFFCCSPEHKISCLFIFDGKKNYHKYKQFKQQQKILRYTFTSVFIKWMWMANIKYSKQFIIIRYVPTIRNGFHRFVIVCFFGDVFLFSLSSYIWSL